MRDHDGLTFSLKEYERRLTELRQRMQERLLDAVIISDPENLAYLTGHQTTGYSFFQALLVPIDREPVSITRHLETSNIEHRTWVEDARYYSDTGDAIQMLYDVIREMGLIGKNVGHERNSYFFPAYQQDRLHSMFSNGNLQDCFGIVEEGRICKSDDEIEVMKKSAKATEAGMKAAYEAVAEGATENEIAAAACSAMFSAGGEYPAVLPYVTSGPRTMIGHATWEGRTVQANEHVFLEMAGCYRRYHTAMMRTVVLGELSHSMYKAQERMKTALIEVERLIRPGVTVSDVDKLVRNIISDNDVGAQLVTRAGYSIGIAFAPSWDEGYMLSLKQGSQEVLKPGMTIHIIPWMYGVDGDKTCGISDTIRVTEKGCESFFDLDRDFVVKPN
ncbi:ectoine hydrolase [Neopusillimonas maritima]|uniref:Peptidase M24 n=1 Tax=Neopusillimonas maritima TaxID=2026239 RepID=A0A3A1YYK3_9BURK|nr:ectoine hydrolase [Neopusillimonas maritima]RIY42571.1 peptidase M24 [Neopusillimonas maritima]